MRQDKKKTQVVELNLKIFRTDSSFSRKRKNTEYYSVFLVLFYFSRMTNFLKYKNVFSFCRYSGRPS